MIYILPFRQRNEIYREERLKGGESVRIIVPHPKLADSARETGERCRPDLNIESTTIADFIKSETLYRNPDIKIYKKYQLILELSTVWKKYFPSSVYDEFFGAFDSFTQLRGITMNFDLLEEILDNSHLGFAAREIEGIKKFWKYLEIREIYDEHAACSRLVRQYKKSAGRGMPEKIILYGFSHLSSGQCDLVNVMGKAHDIIIPINANVWKEVKESDWLKWIDAKVLPIPPCQQRVNEVSLVKIGSNGLSEAIKQLAGTYGKDKAAEIVLAQKNPDFFHISELAWENASFKVDISVFGNVYKKIFNDLEKRFDWREEVETGTILKFLNGMAKEELNKKFDEKDFKTIKMASFIHDEIEKWMELSEENSVMKMFDFYIFESTLRLNLPRNYILPRSRKGMKAKIKGLEEIETVGMDHLVIICATESYSDLDSSEDRMTGKMIDSFLKIGPVKRRELEFRMFKENIVDVLAGSASFLIIEESLMEESLLWSEILSSFDVDEIALEKVGENKKIDYIKSLKKKALFSFGIGKMVFRKNSKVFGLSALLLLRLC